MDKKLKVIYLAGGCFWGVEEYFSRIIGVEKTSVGYANGITEKTTYHDISNTGHSEAVCVRYDSQLVTLETLLKYYFNIINPTSKTGRGMIAALSTGPAYILWMKWTSQSLRRLFN